MTSALEHPHSAAAHHPNVDNLLAAYAGNDRIVPTPHAAGARTVRFRPRRRTFPDSPASGRQFNGGWVSTAVDNFALRELPSLALYL